MPAGILPSTIPARPAALPGSPAHARYGPGVPRRRNHPEPPHAAKNWVPRRARLHRVLFPAVKPPARHPGVGWNPVVTCGQPLKSSYPTPSQTRPLHEVQLTDSLLSKIIRYVRSHTAFRAWLVEILVLFVSWLSPWAAAPLRFGRAGTTRPPSGGPSGSTPTTTGAPTPMMRRLPPSCWSSPLKDALCFWPESALPCPARGGGGNEGRAAAEAELMPVIRELHERIRKLEAAAATPTPEPAPALGAAAHRPAALLCR